MYGIVLQVIGWAGVVAYVASYALLSFGYLGADSIRYQLLNALGGICLVIFSLSLADIPNVAVNAIWILIAIVSLVRILRTRKAKHVSVPMPIQE
jgi:hypothetical protein